MKTIARVPSDSSRCGLVAQVGIGRARADFTPSRCGPATPSRQAPRPLCRHSAQGEQVPGAWFPRPGRSPPIRGFGGRWATSRFPAMLSHRHHRKLRRPWRFLRDDRSAKAVTNGAGRKNAVGELVGAIVQKAHAGWSCRWSMRNARMQSASQSGPGLRRSVPPSPHRQIAPG
jgi:hypothetical protein